MEARTWAQTAMLLGISAILVPLCLYVQAIAPTPPAVKDPLGRETPQDAVYNFLQACQSKNYRLGARYLNLTRLPPADRERVGPESARELEEVLDHDVSFDLAALNRTREGERSDGLAPGLERIDSIRVGGQAVGIQLERLDLHPDFPVWLVSADSVALIPKLYKERSESVVEKKLPEPLVSWTLLDTSLWRWIALVLLAVVLSILSSLLSRGVLAVLSSLAKRIAPKMSGQWLLVFAGPLRLLLIAAGFRAGIALIAPSALLRLYLDRMLIFLSFLAVAWLAMRVIDVATERLRRALLSRQRALTYSVLPLGQRVAKLTICLIAFTVVMSEWGYNTTTILAGLGVGGLAIALAAQKTIENLFGGVSVIGDGPVFVGDFCKFGDRTGVVEDIGLRSTRIRTADRTLVSVPNAQFSSMTLENFSRRDKILFHLTLALRRDTTPDQVRHVLGSVSRLLESSEKVEAGALPVRFVGIGSYSLDVEVFVYILTADGDEFLRVQQDLLLRIMDVVEAAGTSLAVPTQASIVSYDGNPSREGTPAYSVPG